MKRLALLLTALAACSSSHAPDGLPIDVAASDAGFEPKGLAGAAADPARHTKAAPADDASNSRAVASPPDVHDRASVWIGEAEETVTSPENLTSQAGPQRVALILDAVHAVPTGTITFGTAQLPKAQATDTLYPPGANSADIGYWQNAPIEGFEYSLVASQLSGDLLSFAFVPLELYRDYCAFKTSDTYLLTTTFPVRVCECEEDRCKAPSGPQRRIILKVSAQVMEGELSIGPEGTLGEPPIIRLRRVQ